MAMQVTLSQPVALEEVDAEIVVVAGCALGFVAPGQPPHVLHVDVGTDMARHGIQSDDLLVSIDGQNTRLLAQDQVAQLLKGALLLHFERPKARVEAKEIGTEAVPQRDAAVSEEKASVPGLRAPSPGLSRSRSRRRHRRPEQQIANRPAPGPAPPGPPPPPPHHGPAGGPPGGWLVHERGSWPPPARHDLPPPRWLGNVMPPWAPPPGYGPPGHPPPGHPPGPPPHWGPWRPHPPEHWHGPPPVGPYAPMAPPLQLAPPAQPRRENRGRLEQNETGGASIVAERVPPSVNNMDVLNEYFSQFGKVTAMQVNHNRHEAVVTFSRFQDAKEALRFPVLNDPTISLRGWKSKAGQTGPEELPSLGEKPMAKALGPGPYGAAPFVAASPERPVRAPSNMIMESGPLQEKKQQKEALEERRKSLLQGLTDQLRTVMAKSSDPQTSERQREQLQAILVTIRDKITALTPQPQEPPARSRLAPPSRMPPGQISVDFRKPAALRLSSLPADLQGPAAEARLRESLGSGVQSVSWSEDGASCVVRFSERRFAQDTRQAQKVWGFTAEWCENEAAVAPSRLSLNDAAAEVKMPGSPDTEAMDSDIPDEEVMGAMVAAAEDLRADEEILHQDAYSFPNLSETGPEGKEEADEAAQEAGDVDPATV